MLVENLSLGEILSFVGLLMTASAIIWRGGNLSARLSNIETDVSQLVKFQETAMAKFMLTAAATARTEAEMVDLRRRADAMERRCEDCIRWRQRLDDSKSD